MDIPQSLQTIAEISIAFAGFSGLIVAFRRHRGPLTPVERFRLQILLALAFAAMLLAFLPELLAEAGIAAPRVWVASSAVLGGWALLFVGWWTLRSRRISRQVPEIFDWFAFARMAAGHALIITLQLLVVLGVVREHAPAAYLAGLIWFLLHAAHQFARMLFVQPRDPDTAE